MEILHEASKKTSNILGGNSIVNNGNAGAITQNNTPLKSIPPISQSPKETEILIAMLLRQCEEKDRQLCEKDKQIDQLLKAITLISSKE